MKVFVEESGAVPLVSMSLAFKAGSARDPVGKEGLARATARMLRRGGGGLGSQQIEESVDRLGGELSADVGFGWTAVSADVLVRNAGAMAELLGKVVAAPLFDEGELGKLKREIEAEIAEGRDNDRTLAGRALRREVYPGHPYGRRVSGYTPTIQGLTSDDARAHHQRVFCKQNAVMVFSGDVSKKRARELAEALTAGLPEGERLVDPVPEPEPRPGRHLVFVNKPDRTQTQMYVGALGAHPHDDDLTPLQVATSVLGGTFTARMMQQVRVQRGWSYGAYARLGLDRHRELFTMWAAPAAGDAPACLGLLLEMLDRWHADGVTDDELSFMKRYLRRSHVFEIDTAQKRAQQKMEAALLDLPEGYHSGYTDRVKAVTTRQANRAISRRVDPRNLVIAVVGSHDEIGVKVEQAIPGLTSVTVVPYDLELVWMRPPAAPPSPALTLPPSNLRRGPLALLSFAAVLLASVSAAAGPVKLWHAYREGGQEQLALREAIERFRAAHPGVTVETLAVPFEGYASKLGAAIPAGNGPDLFIDAHERVGDFQRLGLVSAAGDALPPGDEGGYARAALDAVTLRGTLYGIPLSRKCLALYLNERLVPVDPPDLEALLDQPRPAGGVTLAHVAGSAYMHAPFLSAFGGSMLGPGDSYGLDSEAGRRSVDYVASLVRRGFVPDEASGSLVSDLFSSGKALAAIGGPWTAGDLKGDVRYRVVPLPPLRGVGPMRPLLTVEAAFVTPQATVEARALARYLGSAEAAEVRARVGKTVSARSTPSSVEASDPFLLAFARAADDAVPMPTSPAMRLTFEPADRALRKVLRGDAPADVALREAAHRFDDVRRPLPPPAAPAPFVIALGLLALAGAAYLVREGSKPEVRVQLRRSLPAYAYLAQAVVAVSVLVVAPLVVGAGTSFFAGRGETLRFVGLAHYLSILTARGGELLGSGSFYLVLLVTILWTLTNVMLHLVLGLIFGLLLSHPTLRFKTLYRVLLIVPWAVPSYVTALAWKGMFHRQYGAINAILTALGAEPVAWFSRFSTAFSANLATNVWLGFPFMMVVTLGAITSVPQDVLEAAEVDGATRWQRLRLVTLPMIRPVLMPAVALGAVWTFNMFNVVFLVSGGDPDGTTDILVSEAYRWAFTREAQMGYAAAYAVLIFLLLFGGTRALNRATGARI